MRANFLGSVVISVFVTKLLMWSKLRPCSTETVRLSLHRVSTLTASCRVPFRSYASIEDSRAVLPFRPFSDTNSWRKPTHLVPFFSVTKTLVRVG